MDRIFSRLLTGPLLGLALGLLGLLGGVAAQAAETRHEDVYYVRQQIGPADGKALIVQQALMPVTLETGASGSRLHARTVWFKADAGSGQRGDSYGLDTRYRDDAAVIAFLTGGIETRLNRSGKVVAVGAADPQALEALAEHRPQVREALAQVMEGVGVRPFVLPEKLRLGQRLRETQTVAGLGELAWSMQVMALDAQRVELQVRGDAKIGTVLDGYQVVHRESGLPVEARLTLSLPDGLVPGQDGPMRMQVLAISQRHAGMMTSVHWNEADWNAYRDNFAELAASPLFRDGVVDEDALLDVEAAIGRMALAQLPAGERERIAGSLVFDLAPANGPRQQLRLSAQYSVESGSIRPRRFWMRLHAARLLDADGRPLAGLTVVPNRLFENSVGYADLELDESDEQFPFRLPPGLPDGALDALDRIELDVELAGHVLGERKVVAAGRQPDGESPRLEWSRHWAELTTASDAAQGDIWVVVPLDAQGEPLRHIPIAYSNHDARTAGAGPLPPLATQARDWHYRVVAEEPIAAVELRRYSLAWERDTWVFANGTGMVAGDELIGERHAAEPLYPLAATVSGQELLAAFDTLVADDSGYEVMVPLRGELADTVVQFCQVVPQVADAMRPEVYRRSRLDSFRSGDPGWVGWMVPSYGFDGDDVRVAATCPSRLEPVRERIGEGRCFDDRGNGHIGIAGACIEDVERARRDGTLVARDGQGRRLAEFPANRTVEDRSMLRFWGKAEAIEFVRVHPRTAERELVLRGAATR